MDEFDEFSASLPKEANTDTLESLMELEEHIIFSGSPELTPEQEDSVVEELDRQGAWSH